MDELTDIIRDEIRREGPMPFARYMALALYHPTLGYYAGGGMGREPLGWSGDYFTSGDVSPLWGWAIARQLRQMWELLGSPPRFDVIEPGAGRGMLAREVWRFARFSAPEWGEALRYTLVDQATYAGETRLAPTLMAADGSEPSLFGARRERLAAELARLAVPDGAVRWVGSLANLNTESNQIIGVIVSNELLDALPVHLVEVVGGARPALAEVYVALDASGRLVERLDAPSSPEVAAYLDRFGVPWRGFGDGWRAEIGLAAEAWMREATGLLQRGFVLSIDYGASARRLYTRVRRRGTLAVYSRHQFGDRPLLAPGRQDITAHVNFSALARAGREQGLRVAGYTTQTAFLTALGVREAAAALGQQLYPAADTARATERGQADLLRRRMLESAEATLLDPRGLGGFRVLVQQRGMPAAKRRLSGLRRPQSNPS
jgi:SAM-dependent MidA family methyltransferase